MIAEVEVMRLSQRDREVFVAALRNPPAPGDKLQASANRYKQSPDTVNYRIERRSSQPNRAECVLWS